jgi:putative transcriptional regulator
MAIGVNLDELLYLRRMTLTELSQRVDITLANLSILKTGKAKAIRFSTLDALCRELECQPGDLIAYTAEEGDAEIADPDAAGKTEPIRTSSVSPAPTRPRPSRLRDQD